MRDNPWIDAHYTCEMTFREREALMTVEDWRPLLRKALKNIEYGWKAEWISSGVLR